MVDAQRVHHRRCCWFCIRCNNFLKFLTANRLGPGVSVIKLDDIPKTRKTKLPGCNETETYIALEKDLLQNGMKLEQISRFLGHSSLESTQIYTHLID